MRVLLLGYPVRHSLSPLFQNAAFEARGLDHSYVVHPVEQFDEDAVRELLEQADVLGANVTVPHKQAILACLDGMTDTARLAGAVNTVFRARDDGRARLMGDNTDVGGFLADLWTSGLGRTLDTAVLLGAGGAARALVVALRPLCREIVVVNRTVERARTLTDSLRSSAPGGAELRAAAWPSEGLADEGLRSAFGRAQLLVDATALGLGCSPGTAQFANARAALARLPLERLPDEALLYDLKYGGATPFLALAAQTGRPHRDGLGMLVGQGALAFQRWTGQPAPVQAMREAVGLEPTEPGG